MAEFPPPVLSCCLNLSNHPLDLFRYMYMCIRIDMNIFCDPYLHVTCLTDEDEKSATTLTGTAHCTDHLDLMHPRCDTRVH